MKTILIAVALLTTSIGAYAACTTHTVYQGGRTTICTTCCSYGNCTTTCY